MKNILITGGSGFVGKNLKEAFQSKYNIFAPSHNELELLDYDALENYISSNQINVIIHSAIHVPIFNGLENEFFNDMKMFLNIEKISSKVERVLYFGSGAEFDKRYNITLVNELDIGKHLPVSQYGLSKYTMNKIATQSNNIYNLRLFGIFGKYELWNIKFISNLCCKAMYDIPLTIRKDCNFDFLYIEDLPAIVEWFIENNPDFHDYNICSGKPLALTEIAELVNKVSQKNLSITILTEGKDLDYTADNLRLKIQIPSLKLTPMETAINELYKYYCSKKNDINYNIIKESK